MFSLKCLFFSLFENFDLGAINCFCSVEVIINLCYSDKIRITVNSCGKSRHGNLVVLLV